MLENYGTVGLFLIVAILFAVVTILLPVLLRVFKVVPKAPSAVKQSTYESGVPTVGRSWVQFNFRYYFYALLLISIDVLVIFLYPWAMELRELGIFGYMVAFVFICIVFVGYIYAWRKGVLEWK